MLFVYLLLLLMIIIWSFSFIIADVMVEFIPPLSIALYRSIIASATFLVMDLYFMLRRKNNNKKKNNEPENTKFSRKDHGYMIIASFAGISIFFLAQYTAINLIGPSLPALFVCLLAPIIIAVFSLIFFKEKLNKLKILGFTIATIGGFLLVTGGDLKNLSPEAPNFLGYILALITPLLWAIYTTIIKKIGVKNSNNNITLLKYVAYFGTIELFFFVLINNEILIFIENFLNIVLFLGATYLGIGCYVFGYYIWQNANEKLKSSKVASFLYVEPFMTLLFSYLLQRNDIIVIWNIIGGIIVLVAVIIINYK